MEPGAYAVVSQEMIPVAADQVSCDGYRNERINDMNDQSRRTVISSECIKRTEDIFALAVLIA